MTLDIYKFPQNAILHVWENVEYNIIKLRVKFIEHQNVEDTDINCQQVNMIRSLIIRLIELTGSAWISQWVYTGREARDLSYPHQIIIILVLPLIPCISFSTVVLSCLEPFSCMSCFQYLSKMPYLWNIASLFCWAFTMMREYWFMMLENKMKKGIFELTKKGLLG
jgi:hypothetical protein